jgi:hypothetical protein
MNPEAPLNEAPVAPEAPETPELPPRAAAKPEPVYNPMDEDEELLFGPTSRPQEKFGANGIRTQKRLAPKDLPRYLGVLSEASKQPDAPPEMMEFMRILAYHIGNEV